MTARNSHPQKAVHAKRRIPRRAFGILLSLEPVMATLAGWLVLGQSVGLLAIGAIAAVVAASVGSTLSSADARAAEGAAASEAVSD